MIRRFENLGLLLLGLLGLYSGPVSAQSNDAGVLCSEIEGGSVRPGDVGCIDVMAWSWGQSVPIAIGGGGGTPTVGNPSLQDFSFTKSVDASSENFFGRLVTGTPFKGVVEYKQYQDCGTSCQAPEPYLTINFRDVWISSFSHGGSSGSQPAENLSLSYVEVSYCYRPILKDTTLGSPQCFAFSRETNQPIAPF